MKTIVKVLMGMLWPGVFVGTTEMHWLRMLITSTVRINQATGQPIVNLVQRACCRLKAWNLLTRAPKEPQRSFQDY